MANVRIIVWRGTGSIFCRVGIIRITCIWARMRIWRRICLHTIIAEHRVVLVVVWQLEGVISRRWWSKYSIPSYLCVQDVAKEQTHNY